MKREYVVAHALETLDNLLSFDSSTNLLATPVNYSFFPSVLAQKRRRLEVPTEF